MTLGEKLKRAREAKHLTLPEMQERTKIQMRYLEALENDDRQNLPGAYNTKLFLKAYALQVGLDPEQVIREFEGAPIHDNMAAYEATAVRGSRSRHNNEGENEKKPRWLPALLLTLIFVLVVGSVAYAFVTQHKRFEANSDVRTSYSVEEEPTKAKKAKTKASDDAEAKKAAAAADKKKKEVADKKKLTFDMQAASTNVVNIQAENIKGNANLVLNGTNGRCWVSALADGQSLFQGVVELGSKKVLNIPDGTKTLNLQLGNAPMLSVTLNDKPVDFSKLPGLSKQLSLKFTLDYLED